MEKYLLRIRSFMFFLVLPNAPVSRDQRLSKTENGKSIALRCDDCWFESVLFWARGLSKICIGGSDYRCVGESNALLGVKDNLGL